MSDKLSFLDGGNTAAPSSEPVSEPVPEAPAVTDTVDIAAPAVVPTEPQIAPSIPPGYVPLAAQLDERDKRQELQRRFEDQQKQFEAAQKQLHELQSKPVEVPDMFGDPDGFRAHLEQRQEAALWSQKVGMSQVMASQQFGQQIVDDAIAAFQRDNPPGSPTAQEMMKQPHPVGFVVQWHKRNALMAQIGDDPDAFVKRRAAELGLIPGTQAANPETTTAATSSPRPLSIVGAPSATGVAPMGPTGPGVAFQAVFKR